MSQPSVHVKVNDAAYVYGWLRQLFIELKLLKKNKVTIELIRPDNGQKPFIAITRKG